MNLFKRISLGTLLLFSFLLIVIVFLVISISTFINVNKLVSTSDIERHTIEVQEHLVHILSNLSDAETGQRGYLLTGELKYLEPYNSGIFLVNEEVAKVKRLTEDNPNQQTRIANLELLIEAKS